MGNYKGSDSVISAGWETRKKQQSIVHVVIHQSTSSSSFFAFIMFVYGGRDSSWCDTHGRTMGSTGHTCRFYATGHAHGMVFSALRVMPMEGWGIKRFLCYGSCPWKDELDGAAHYGPCPWVNELGVRRITPMRWSDPVSIFEGHPFGMLPHIHRGTVSVH